MNKTKIAREKVKALKPGDEVDIHECCIPQWDSAMVYRVGRELGRPVSVRIVAGRFYVRLREVQEELKI